uniref:DUF19 domain-containing protein n=1 Tax=Strongyloides papillosus TaxID=174720 RepID=A0A0N5BVI9_STREA
MVFRLLSQASVNKTCLGFVCSTIFSILAKKFQFDFDCLDKKQREFRNIELLPSSRDETMPKLKDRVILIIEEQIYPSSVVTMGYNIGHTCRIVFYLNTHGNELLIPCMRKTMHKVTGYMTFAKPYCDENEFCYETDVTIDIPYEDNDDISCADFI